MLLAACTSEPRYEAPPTGASLSFVQNIAPLRATSRVTARISIARANASGDFVPVGQLSGDMLSVPTLLVSGVPHSVIADFAIRNVGVSGRLSDRLVFTPKADIDYQLVISYLETGYGISLIP